MKSALTRYAIACVAIINLFLFSPSVIQAKEFPELKNDKYTVTMVNANIIDYITSVSNALEQTFLVDPRVEARLNVANTGPLSATEYYQLFLSVLQSNGYVAIERKEITIILPESSEILRNRNDEPVGRLITPSSKPNAVEQKSVRPRLMLTLPISAAELRDLAVRNPPLLSNVFSFEPHRVNGKLIGYMIMPNALNPRALETYGILEGDVISEVNNISLNSQKQAIRAMRNAAKANALDIVVMRNGIDIPIAVSLER